MNIQISNLLVGISRLYLEFAHCSTSLRDYAYYKHLYDRTNDYITHLHEVTKDGEPFTNDETSKICATAMQDFISSLRDEA